MTDACGGVDRSKLEGSLEKDAEPEVGVGLTTIAVPNLGKDAEPEVGVGYRGDQASPDTKSREKKNGSNVGEDRMEFEEGGGFVTSS